MSMFSQSPALLGSFYATSAYLLWGLLPVYWKAFGAIPAMEILAHRTLWSLVFVAALIGLQRRWKEVKQVIAKRSNVWILLVSSCLLAGNWLTYIWAVNANHILDASLGYFILPLVNVLLGFVFLKERFNLWQTVAIVLACLGVLNFIWSVGTLPWIALVLAFSFAIYGLLRKIVKAESLVGLGIETFLMLPFGLGYALYLETQGTGHYFTDWYTAALFAGAGVITAVPLICFAHAARRLRLSTMGFFQYIAPTCNLLLGVWVYSEPFTETYQVTFGFIWAALIVYSANSMWVQRQTLRVSG